MEKMNSEDDWGLRWTKRVEFVSSLSEELKGFMKNIFVFDYSKDKYGSCCNLEKNGFDNHKYLIMLNEKIYTNDFVFKCIYAHEIAHAYLDYNQEYTEPYNENKIENEAWNLAEKWLKEFFSEIDLDKLHELVEAYKKEQK